MEKVAKNSLRSRAKAAGIAWGAVNARLNRYGWTEEEALTTPTRVAKFPSDDPQYFRRRHLWKHFRLLLEDYERMLSEQAGCCAICKRPEEKWGEGRVGFVVDHCHATGKNRGILCYSCNVAIGHFQDNPAVIRAAADYVEKHRG